MIKAELVTILATEAGYPQYIAKKTIRALIKIIQDTLRRGDSITLYGIGTFRVRDRATKIVQDFDGDYLEVKMGRKVCFKPSRNLKKLTRFK